MTTLGERYTSIAFPGDPAGPVFPGRPRGPRGSCPRAKSTLRRERFLTSREVTLLAGSRKAA